MHPISPVFINLIFETVNGSCVDRIKRKTVPVIYDTTVEKMLTYCCFEVWFNLKLCPLVIDLFINCK